MIAPPNSKDKSQKLKCARRSKSTAKGRSLLARFVWGSLLCVVLFAVIIFIYQLNKGDSSGLNEDAAQPAKNPSMISEAVPATASMPIENAVEVPATNPPPKKEKLEPGTKRHVNWVRPANWDQLTRAQKTRAQPVGRVIKPIGWDDRKLFTQPSDKRIERLMRVQPGQLVLGTVTYNEKFVSDFLESLKTQIEFEEEDTEADRAMKQAVKDAREDLKAAYDRGEDIVEIMNATEKELHDLAAYKLDLRKLIVEYRQSGEHSDQDVKDYIEAANTILSEHGMEPLRLGEIWFRKSQYENSVEEMSNEE